MSVVVGCSELVQSAVSPGGPTEGLLKVCLDSTMYMTLHAKVRALRLSLLSLFCRW